MNIFSKIQKFYAHHECNQLNLSLNQIYKVVCILSLIASFIVMYEHQISDENFRNIMQIIFSAFLATLLVFWSGKTINSFVYLLCNNTKKQSLH